MTLRIIPLFLIPLIIFLLGPYGVVDSVLWVGWGKTMISEGSLYVGEISSIIKTDPIIFNNWSIAIIYYWVDSLFGIQGLMHFHHLLIFPLFYLIYKQTALLESPVGKGRYWVYLSWLGMIPAMTERPSYIALIPLVFLYQELSEDFRFEGKRIIRILLLTFVWVNLHGSFVLIPYLVGWNILFRFLKKPDMSIIAEALKTPLILIVGLINPYGYKIYEQIFINVNYSKARGIMEWNSWNWSSQFPQIQLGLILIALIVGILIYQKRFWKLVSDPYFGILLMGVFGVRHTVFSFLLMLPFLSRVGFLNKSEQDENPKVVGFVSFVLVLISIMLIPPLKSNIAKYLPEGRKSDYEEYAFFKISDYLKNQNLKCSILNNYAYGAFLSYRNPNYKLFVDGKNTPYPPSSYEPYEKALAGIGTEEYLKKYNPCFALLHKKQNKKLINYLNSTGRKTILTEGNATLIKVRTNLSGFQ